MKDINPLKIPIIGTIDSKTEKVTFYEPIQEKELKWIGVDLDRTIAQNSDHPEYKLLKPVKGRKLGRRL